jgi:hypothetical protein
MVLGDAPSYAPPAAGPGVYVVALVAARRPEARGVGGFDPTETFLVGEWVGQVLQRTVRPAVV